MKTKSILGSIGGSALIATVILACGSDLPEYQGNNEDDPDEVVRFLQPAEDTFYTNDEVVFEVEVDEGVQVHDLELFIPATESRSEEGVATLEDSLTYTWSTASRDQGSYDIRLRYNVDGAVTTVEEARTIIVDRQVPEIISTTPEPGVSAQAPTSPIEVTFDEALAASSIDEDTVQLMLDGQELDSTATISDDGLTMAVEFTAESADLPYEILLILDGVSDLAGNEVDAEISWQVQNWGEEPFEGDSNGLALYDVVELEDQEYLIARHVDGDDSTIKIFEANNGEWDLRATSDIYNLEIVAIDAVAASGQIHMAVVQGQSQVRRTRMVTFNPVTGSVSQLNCNLPVGAEQGKTSVSMDIAGDDGVVATVNDGTLYVHEFGDFDFCDDFEPSLDVDTYTFVRGENIKADIDENGAINVVFAQCSTAADPCLRTHIRHLTKPADDQDWTLESGELDVDGNIHACDLFTNFDAVLDGDDPTAILSLRGGCPGVPRAYGANGPGMDEEYFEMQALGNSIPGNDTTSVYTPTMVADGTGFDVLFAATRRLEIMRAESGSLTWVGSIETGLNPEEEEATQYRGAELFRTSHGLVSVVGFGDDTHVFRALE